jgi:pimeloyl-ACP methyl ester carboxylesterase
MPPVATDIPDALLARFPPAFLIHAVYDPDVPYGGSKRLARKIPGAHLVTIYEGEVHDVDRDPAAGLPLYRRAIAWLADTLNAP